MTKVALLGARIIDPASGRDEYTNLYLADGKIVAIGPQLDNFEPDSSLDLTTKIIIPGLVDLHAHLLDSIDGFNRFSDYLEQASAAGITHVCTPAFYADHSLTSIEIAYLLNLANKTERAQVSFIGSLTENLQGTQLCELKRLQEAGCIGFSNGSKAITNTLIKSRCYQYAAMLGLKLFIQAQDPYLANSGYMHEGEMSAQYGVPGISFLAETLAVGQELLMIQAYGVSAHFHALSARQTLALLTFAQQNGLAISSDVAIAHLFLTDQDVKVENGFYAVNPPLRSNEDRQQLQMALTRGVISCIASNHKKLPLDVKQLPLQETSPGLSTWPLLLPLTLKLAQQLSLPLIEVIKSVTTEPADVLGIDAGRITPGDLANLCIFDPEKKWSLDSLAPTYENHSAALHTLQGQVEYTFVNGRQVYQR